MGPKRKFTTRLCKVQCFTFTFWLCNANVFSDFAFLFYGTRYYWFVQDIPISKFQPNKKENIEERRRRLWRQGSGWENTFLMITLLKFRSMGMFFFFSRHRYPSLRMYRLSFSLKWLVSCKIYLKVMYEKGQIWTIYWTSKSNLSYILNSN